MLNGDIDDKVKTILPRVFEESVRRATTLSLPSRDIVLRLLGINPEIYTQNIDL
jgi:hypothetical protein